MGNLSTTVYKMEKIQVKGGQPVRSGKGLPMARLIVFYDERCGFCCRVVSLLAKLSPPEVVYRKAAEMEGFTQYASALQNRYRDLYALSDETMFQGYDAYLQIAGKTPLLKPLAFLMRFAFLRFMGKKIYRFIANHRICESDFPKDSARKERG